MPIYANRINAYMKHFRCPWVQSEAPTKGVFKREGALLHPKKISHKLRLEFAEDKYPNGDERRSLLFISFPQPSMF